VYAACSVGATWFAAAPATIADRRDPPVVETDGSPETDFSLRDMGGNAGLPSDRFATEWGSREDDTLDGLLVEPLLPILAEDALLPR